MAFIQIVRNGVGARELARLERKVDALTQAFNDQKAQLARIDAATTDIATDIRALLDKIATGMTAEEVATVTAGLTAAADTLESTAAQVT